MSFFARLGSGSDTDSDSGSDSEESILSGSEGEEQDRKLAAKKSGGGANKASMFLRSDDDDSDSDEDDDDEEMSEDDSDEDGGNNLANRFLKGAASSDEDSDEEDKTVVLSAKDKRFAEMDAAIQNIQNATKNSNGAANDWVLASSELDKLLRFIGRHQVSMSASPIPPAGHIPPQFLSVLVDLDDAVNRTVASEKSASKKMPAGKAKALTAMRQTIKKKAKEFEAILASYREDPAAYAAAYDKANVVPSAPKAPKKVPGAEGQEDTASADFTTIGKGGKQLALTADGVFKTLREIVEQRGRKNTDRAEVIRILMRLLEVCETTYQRLRVLLAIIPARLDYSQALVSMPHDSWVSAQKEMDQLVSLLLKEKAYVVQENVEDYDDMVERAPEAGKRVAVPGNLISLLENLDNEFTKTLQNTDAHEKGSEYIERLRSESPLYTTIVKAQILFEGENATDAVVRSLIRRVEHIYYKPDVIVSSFERSAASAVGDLKSRIATPSDSVSPSELIHKLCVVIYNSDAPLLRARAVLMHIFNLGMHGQYHRARDYMLMSHLQDSVSQADPTTQLLYNRAMMQLGLAAFRNGLISECQTHLADMFTNGRQKELTAQGVPRHGQHMQLTPEQELIEKRRLLPFHMHLNLELLEAAYLTSCMLIDIPLLASVGSEDQRRRVVSKTFKRLLDMADKQAFMGPPENTRDHIVKASKAMQIGEWERAQDLILTIKVWQLLDNAEDVKAMLSKQIQEQGLRTYLFTYSPYYKSLSLSHLAQTFALPLPTVKAIISRMVYASELEASLDPIDNVVVFLHVEQTEVQRLSLQLAERASLLVDNNEKYLDQKLGNAGASGPQGDRAGATGAGGERRGGERRGGGRGGGRGGMGGRGRGRGGFNSGLGSSMGQRRTGA